MYHAKKTYPYLIKHHAMKTYVKVEVLLHSFLISALDVGELSISRPGRFTPRENPQYPLDKRLGRTCSLSGRGGEEKDSKPVPGIESWPSSL
jgi:hypothetical protein